MPIGSPNSILPQLQDEYDIQETNTQENNTQNNTGMFKAKLTKNPSFLGKIKHLKSYIDARKFLKLFLTIFILILIINIFLFTFWPEQYYNAANDEKQKSTENDILKASDKKTVLDGPYNTFDRCVDALYFSTTQLSTIGYGDITPKQKFSKIYCSIIHILIIGLSFRFIGGSISGEFYRNFAKKFQRKS